MSKTIHIYSDNSFFYDSLNLLVQDLNDLKSTSCSGNIAIVDAGSISNVESIIWPEPVCHILFVISREAHKSFLSSFDWNISVSYISYKCTPDEFESTINSIFSNVKRRITCKAFYNIVTHDSLSERELKITSDFMQGKTLSRLSTELDLNYKTVANYRSRLLSKSFGKLDIKGIRTFNLSLALRRRYIKNDTINFNVDNLYNCPVR